MTYERFEATDTRGSRDLKARESDIEPLAYSTLLESMRQGHRRAHDELTPGAVGCALSHVGVSRLALSRGLTRFAVFEDDAELPECVLSLMERATAEAPTGWHCILLGWSGAPPAVPVGSLLQPVEKFWALHSYMLSAEGAQLMVRLNTPVRTHADHAMARGAARGEVRIYGVGPQEMRIQQCGKGSDVQMVVK